MQSHDGSALLGGQIPVANRQRGTLRQKILQWVWINSVHERGVSVIINYRIL